MPDDRRLAELVGETLRPKPMDPAARAAFRRAVESRIEARDDRRVVWRGALVLAASAAAAAVLWLASVPSSTPNEPVEVVREETAPAAVFENAEDDLSVLAAYADPDEILDDPVISETSLPDDYFVLASLVDELDG